MASSVALVPAPRTSPVPDLSLTVFARAGHFMHMRLASSLRSPALFLSLTCLAGCMEPRFPDEFEENIQAVWGAEAGVLGPFVDAGPARPADPGSGFLPISPTSPPLSDAGRSDPPRPTGPRVPDAGDPPPGLRPDPIISADAGAILPSDAGSGAVEASTSPEPAAGLTTCTISASTDASDAFFYNGKYGCGVWIANASSKAVKVFFVATRIANRSGLTSYRSAVAGVSVDVVAGATLNAPKQHQYTWDLKDLSGAPLPPGSYKLMIETKSSNGATVVSVPFDTSKGAVSESATPAGEVRSASIKCQ